MIAAARLMPAVLTLMIVVVCRSAEVVRIDVNHEYVVTAARELAAKPFVPRTNEVPDFLKALTYDDYHRIRFVEDNSLWRTENLPFRVQFFHPGNLFHHTVQLNEFAPGFSQRIPFVRTSFDYGDLKLPGRLPSSLQYAGFRVLYRLNRPKRFDELVAFLGASYYRALGRGHRYGTSARGLAINFGGPEPEEFPAFVEFWLGKPAGKSESVTIHGLLDSPSVAGAYTFEVTPGDETVITTSATLFFRQPVATIGLAPLTSMFWFGENSEHRFGDFRSEVHDADGLLVAPDAETRTWHPLENPRAPRVTRLPGAHGFGLLQRDRRYASYADDEARYDLRPGVWVEPVGTWPAGHVRLLELSTADEYNDNIVAAWVPEAAPAIGQRFDFAYRQHWTSAETFAGPPAHVTATRRTVRVEQRPNRTMYVLDFNLSSHEGEFKGAAPRGEVTIAPPAQVLTEHIHRIEAEDSWRLAFTVDAPVGTPPLEIRARLVREDEPLSETWVTTWEQ